MNTNTENLNELENNLATTDEPSGLIIPAGRDTWASEEAPWVGAEERWRASIVPDPVDEPSYNAIQPDIAFRLSVYENLSLTDDESKHMQTVNSTLMPEKEEQKKGVGRTLLSHGLIAAAAVLLTWTGFNVYAMTKIEKPEPVRTSLRVAEATLAVPVLTGKRGEDLTSPAITPAAVENEEMIFNEAPGERSSRRDRNEQSADAEEQIPEVIRPEEPSPAEAVSPVEPDTKALDTILATGKTEEEPAQAVLPEFPARDDITRAMDRVTDEVRKCGVGQTGRVVVELRVSGETGRVVSATTVDETFAGTAVGRCAASAAFDAKFPKFTKPALTIKYPYNF